MKILCADPGGGWLLAGDSVSSRCDRQVAGRIGNYCMLISDP